MLRRVGPVRHLVVVAAALVAPALVVFGALGAGRKPERFDAKQVVVSPAGGDAVRIREVVDIDFGNQERRGYQRVIPNDFGVPVDIEASSPDAPADVFVEPTVDGRGQPSTRIRVGDPSASLTGQHRYVLSYTLPEAQLSSGELALDIIGTDETFETERFEVVLTGFELDPPRCNTGGIGASGGCTFQDGGDGSLVAVIEPLAPGEGITVGGPIVALTPPVEVRVPDLPPRREDWRGLQAIALLLGGIGVGASLFTLARRRGRNQVAAGGAVGAAFPAPGSPVELVPDDRFDDLATTEFAPPKGITPWAGRVLLTERVDRDTVSAWMAEMVAAQAVEVQRDPPRLVRGPGLKHVDKVDRGPLVAVFGQGSVIALDEYQPAMAKLWAGQQQRLLDDVKGRGWWIDSGPGTLPRWPGWLWLVLGGAALVFAACWVGVGPLSLGSWLAAVAVAVFVVVVAALAAYAPLLAVRSAAGSALALQTESFRRFLQASEGRHVDWAWTHGLLRDYSAWAVALDAADAWARAVAASSVPPTDSGLVAPLGVHWAASALHTSTVKPTSSGSGSGGGGFSSGGVGGGGGGGSSGSW